jgi:hypothetical protein
VEHRWKEEGGEARRRLHDSKGDHIGKPPILDPPPSLKVEWWGVWNVTSTVDLGAARLTLQIHAREKFHIGPPPPIKARMMGGVGLELNMDRIYGCTYSDHTNLRAA